MKRKLNLLMAIICCSIGHAQIGFQENIVIDHTHGVLNVKSVFSADLDGDGFKDVLSASEDDNKIAWHKNINGTGEFGEQSIIFDNAIEAKFVHAGDIDGDGDIDVLSASSGDNTIAWYENLDGLGNFSQQKKITESALGAISVYAIDIDSDGDLDVLSASSNDDKIAWYENDGNGIFGTQQIITTNTDLVMAIYPVDMDGDNDIDIISASSNTDEIALFENVDGLGSFATKKIIATNIQAARSVFAADVDSDGDMDILSASHEYNGKLVWFENYSNSGFFSSDKKIATVTSACSVFAEDLDGDGDIDILDSTNSGFSWYENTDGMANFIAKQEIGISDRVVSHFITDLNNDTYPDIITGFYDQEILWYKNTDGNGNFDTPKFINKGVDGLFHLASGDIDGDGDLDISSISSRNKLVWYENIDGNGTFGKQNFIETNPNSIDGRVFGVLFNVDMDGDNDLDIITAIDYRSENDELVWFENIDGLGNFTASHNILINQERFENFKISDLDGDGDIDIVSQLQGKISWYQNIDGKGNFGTEQLIFSESLFLQNIVLSDIDGDNDLDVISPSNKSLWIHENLDGLGTFGQSRVSGESISWGYKAIFPEDMDGDGNIDLVCLNSKDELFWQKNIDGLGSFGDVQLISRRPSHSEKGLDVKDMDGDGDMDVVTDVSSYDQINWFENIDGKGNFTTGQTITANNSKYVLALSIIDIDSDGMMDVLSGAIDNNGENVSFFEIAWYKNLGHTKNEIKGFIRLDTNLNGCDEVDLAFPNLMVIADNGVESHATFSLDNGYYQLFPEEGVFTTKISSTLPAYYEANPISYSSSFSGVGSTDILNFCITPSQTINDVNITMFPIRQARPGFDTNYQLVFHNVGTTQLSGDIILEFDDSYLTFLTASETVNLQTINSLTFNYTDLNPFESRTINLNFNVLPPPTTSIGELLSFTARINPVSGDATEGDNIFNLEQTVIGSYDPNDISVLEGGQILLENADEYLHYIIRFQNTGNASAINVKVDNLLDSNLDWTTLQLESSSHTNRVEIKNGSEVSFIFDNIYLPDSTNDEPNSHGFIAYKIKPKSNITVGEIMTNNADIIFDFNLPIYTNIVNTEITNSLGLFDNAITNFNIFPNPTKGNVYIESIENIKSIMIYNNLGKLIQQVSIVGTKKQTSVSTQGFTTGVYYLKVESVTGIGYQKLMKK